MKKINHLKTWILCGAIVGIVLTVSLCSNRWLTRIVCAELDNSISQLDTLDIRYGGVRLLVLSGHVWIDDVYLQTDTLYQQADSTRQMTRVEIGQMSIDGVNFWKWLVQKRIQVRGITIKSPHVTSWVKIKSEEEKLMGEELRRQIKAEQEAQIEQAMEVARAFVEEAVVDRITIRNAQVHVGSINNCLRTSIEDASMEIYGIGYSFIDSIPYHYNDSVFHFDVSGVQVVLPDGMTQLHSRGMVARPGGVVRLDTTWVESRFSKDGKQFVSGQIAGLRIGGFDALKFNQTKSLNVRSIHLDRPTATAAASTLKPQKTQAELRLEKKHAEQLSIQQRQHWEEIQEQVMMFLTEVSIDTIQIHNVSGQFASTSDHLLASIDSLSLGVYGIGYSLLDSIPYHYNDSVYEFSLAHARIITPDSLIEVINEGMHYTNGGAFSVGRTRVHHIVDRWELSPRKGNTPQAWIDLTMESLSTSQKNVVREAFTLDKGFGLDTVRVHVSKLELHKDARFKPTHPYSIPQAAMLNVEYPFHIHHVEAKLDDMTIHVGMTKEAVGTLQLGPLNASVSNITAVKGETIRAKAKGRMGKGKLDLDFRMIVNQEGNWDMSIDAHDLDMHHLDGMVYPLVGMKIGCDVQHMTAHYGGDGQNATGTFCMEYSNLDVHADKESPSPIKVVADLSGLINSFAKSFLPKQNPAKPGMEPRAYNVKWKNDPWKEPAFFYIGPIIDGAVETMLPGIFASQKIKEKK